MAKKTYAKNNKSCKVTFQLPPAVGAEEVSVCGDFNDWSPTANPMTKRKDGQFSTSVTLPAKQSYRYRFLLDGQRWENDWDAEVYLPNEFGTEDSVIRV
ncbi:MAG: isoamylase early set domain-containing protein [Actinomycetota bacterium]|nr:isoamylase early set domain-containing protein [Actinomycetota bacterium]